MHKTPAKLHSNPKKEEKDRGFLEKYPVWVWGFFLNAFLIITALAFFHLGSAPLENWDEAWYADVTRNMIQSHNYFVATWNEALWLDKPPMFMWLSAFVASFIGMSELAVRVPSAISGIIVVMLVLWFTYRNYGLVPSLMAFVTLACNNLFVWRMRSGNIDLVATLFIFLFFLVQVSKLRHRYLLLGLLLSCLYMTKASLVVFPILVFILHEVFFERQQIKEHFKSYGAMLGIALALPVLWLIIGTMQIGPQFFQYFMFKSDQGVATVGFSKFSMDYVMYMYYSLQRRFTAVLVVGVLFALRYIKDSKVFLMLMYGSLLLIQLSFTERSNNWYLIPSMPFWSLLCAFGTYHVLKLVRNNIIVVVLVVAATVFLGYRTFITSIAPTLQTQANVAQKESSVILNTLTKEGDVIVRLDHLYPTTVYYSQRRVLASPVGQENSIGYWLSRKDLEKKVRKHKIKWILGTNTDIAAFQSSVPDVSFKVRKIDGGEYILEVRD